jgi:long-chain acyl-CoA synthetase
MHRHQALEKLSAKGMPLELHDILVYGKPRRAFKNAPQSLRALFQENRSDATFVVVGKERYTFNQTWHEACAIGHGLVKEYEIMSGDRVGICMRNFPEWIVAFQAITSIGAIAVAMNSLWQADELKYGLDDSGCKLLICDQERIDLLSSYILPCEILVVRSDVHSEYHQWQDLRLRYINHSTYLEMPDAKIQRIDDAIILYTSGSTGRPKGVISSHLAIVSALLSWEIALQIWQLIREKRLPKSTSQPASLLAVPLFHATGCHAIFLAAFRSQTQLVLTRKWDPLEAAKLINNECISTFIAPAAMTEDLIYHAKISGNKLSSLLSVGGGGAARAPEQVKNIDATFARALPNTGWGMTETNSIGTAIAGENYLEKPGSSGLTAAVLDKRIANEQGRTLKPRTRGEVQVRGTSMFRCYWNKPKATADAYIDDWFRTGDIGYLDDDGYLFVVDRLKDMVIRGGENIGCGEVEAAILTSCSS